MPCFMVILRSMSLWSNLQGMWLRGNHLRCVFCDELFTDSRKVHVLGLPSFVAFSPPLASYHAHPIPLCSLRRLRVVLSFLQLCWWHYFNSEWVMTRVFLLQRLLYYNNTSKFVTWRVLDTFGDQVCSSWGEAHFDPVELCPWHASGDMTSWVQAKDLTHGSSPIVLVLCFHSLRILIAIKDCWASFYISPSLAPIFHTRLVSWVSSCRKLNEFTGRELCRFKHTSSDPQGEGSSIDDTVISILKPTLTLGMQMTREILNLLQAIALTFQVTSSPGNLGTRRWYHAPGQSLSIKLWLRPPGDGMASIISRRSRHFISFSNAHALW